MHTSGHPGVESLQLHVQHSCSTESHQRCERAASIALTRPSGPLRPAGAPAAAVAHRPPARCRLSNTVSRQLSVRPARRSDPFGCHVAPDPAAVRRSSRQAGGSGQRTRLSQQHSGSASEEGRIDQWQEAGEEGWLQDQQQGEARVAEAVAVAVDPEGKEPSAVAVAASAAESAASMMLDTPPINLGNAGPYERDYTGTQYIPIYVMLPLGVVSLDGQVCDPDALRRDLIALRSACVDGVMVDCWWGIVEGRAPQQYDWSGYRKLFTIVQEAGLKLQVVMSFHQCGGNVGDDMYIPLPQWVRDIGRSNPDIFFTDRSGRPNPECLSWGIDKRRVLAGRTALEVYYDYMRSFRQEFDSLFESGTVSEVEVGLGPCGELRYPSYPESHGWQYPGIGEFVCYDKYLLHSLQQAADARGHAYWGQPPGNAGSYNDAPHDTEFFKEDGSYDGFYGRFFLKWYANTLVQHGETVLSVANLAFEGTPISAKVSGIHWWYKSASHAAELTAGFYNPHNRDGYAAVTAMLARQRAALNFTCVELRTRQQQRDTPEAMADPEGLVWQVLNAAWEAGIPVASENALPCYSREGYNKVLANAKPSDDPDRHHLSAFTYLRLCSDLMEEGNFKEFARFVARLHGDPIPDEFR